jgi:hypothetical protein
VETIGVGVFGVVGLGVLGVLGVVGKPAEPRPPATPTFGATSRRIRPQGLDRGCGRGGS